VNPTWPPLPPYQAPTPVNKAKAEPPNLGIRVIVFLIIGAVFMLGFVFLLNQLWR
jgi:hypothetical protein